MIWIDCNPHAGRDMKDLYPLVVLSARIQRALEANERR
jgi:hypothetical protein